MRATAYLSSCHGNPVGERLCDESWSGSPHSKGLILLFPRDTPPEHPPPNLPAPPHPASPHNLPRGTLQRRHYTFIVFRQVIIFSGAETSERSESHGCVIMRKMIHCDATRLSEAMTVPVKLQGNYDVGSTIPGVLRR